MLATLAPSCLATLARVAACTEKSIYYEMYVVRVPSSLVKDHSWNYARSLQAISPQEGEAYCQYFAFSWDLEL